MDTVAHSHASPSEESTSWGNDRPSSSRADSYAQSRDSKEPVVPPQAVVLDMGTQTDPTAEELQPSRLELIRQVDELKVLLEEERSRAKALEEENAVLQARQNVTAAMSQAFNELERICDRTIHRSQEDMFP